MDIILETTTIEENIPESTDDDDNDDDDWETEDDDPNYDETLTLVGPAHRSAPIVTNRCEAAPESELDEDDVHSLETDLEISLNEQPLHPSSTKHQLPL